jgi:hypothetical protein
MFHGVNKSLTSLGLCLCAIGSLAARAQDCESQTTCEECVRVFPCGWCIGAENGAGEGCTAGSEVGPYWGACDSWYWEPSDCPGGSDGVTYTYYPDTDGDGHGDPTAPLTSTSPTPPDGYVTDHTDPDDTDPAVTGDETFVYYWDADGDGYGDPDHSITTSSSTPPLGYSADNTDADDTNPQIYTDETFTYYRDADGDGYGDATDPLTSSSPTPPAGYASDSTDLDDADPTIRTSIFTYYQDADGDGYGDPGSATTTGSDTPPAGYVTDNTDSNDGDPTVHPGGGGGGTVPCPLTSTALLTVTLVGLLRGRPRWLGRRAAHSREPAAS